LVNKFITQEEENMAILAFQKPEKVIMIEADDSKGTFEFRPLEPGFGITIGNALRRILLSSLEGFAITSLKIEGVDMEFSSIKGVVEDVTDIILNLKKIRFKRLLDSETSERVHLVISGQDVFSAGDINKFLSVFQVLNPEVSICHMEPSVKLTIDLTIDKGRGYVPAEENKVVGAPLGTIAIDSIHTPIKNVKYTIENFRVEQKTDYEKLILDIVSDGSIQPKEALKEAARILIHHFMLFSDEKITIDTEEKAVAEEFDETSLHIRQLLKTKLVDMDLSVRALNCLKAADVETLGELVSYNKNDLLKFRNFGKKSLTELEELVKSKSLEFGMNIAKYKLDKD
jgi:DNA-directed RNA polymerase subunit alpha